MTKVELGDAPKLMAERTPALEYKPDPHAVGRVTVRGFRLLLALTLLNTTLLGMSVMGPQLFPFLRAQWQEWRAERAARAARQQGRQVLLAAWQKAAAYVPPADAVWEEDPAEATRLIEHGGSKYVRPSVSDASAPPGWVPPVFAAAPNELTVVQPYGSGFSDLPVLFLHERSAPGTGKCLVVIQFLGQSQFEERMENDQRISYAQKKTRHLTATAWRLRDDGSSAAMELLFGRDYSINLPDSALRPVASRKAGLEGKMTVPKVDYGNVLRWFAGEADAADGSHFVLHYRLDGRDGAIDGWLKDDRIELRPRDGTWTFDAGEVLHLNAPPATQPTIYPP